MDLGYSPAALGQEAIPLFFRGFVSSKKGEESGALGATDVDEGWRVSLHEEGLRS